MWEQWQQRNEASSPLPFYEAPDLEMLDIRPLSVEVSEVPRDPEPEAREQPEERKEISEGDQARSDNVRVDDVMVTIVPEILR